MLLNKYTQILITGTALAFVTLSCSKKTDTPAPTTTFSYTINGKNYSHSSAISITNPFSSGLNITQTTPTPASGGYFGANGSEQSNGTTAYVLVIGAENIVATGDTLGFVLGLVSSSSISTGSYTIIPISSSGRKETSFSVADAFISQTSLTPNKGASATSGTLTISSIDNTNHKVSGTFNFIASYTDSSTSHTTTFNVTNGAYSNITFQQF